MWNRVWNLTTSNASKHVSNYTYLFKMIVFLQIEKWGFLDQSFQREQIIWAFFFLTLNYQLKPHK